ncbi:MAG: type I restriction enzyme HsdR N-terminal domain-containing protein [Rikenellaceae bacterium]|nr:type I restriction enzyme HsdR N-terminal domain-containing protein [Rikenellaceae bacterium]
MERHPRLNFPVFRFRVTADGARHRIWDTVRGRWLVLTPEEWVRAHVLRYLTACAGVPGALIRGEYPVSLNGQPQRADVVVCTRDGQPWLLVECKAPEVEVLRPVLDQAVRYNSVLGARYVWITNGLTHYCYRLSPGGDYEPMDCLPGPDEMAALTAR